jgi:Clostripain family
VFERVDQLNHRRIVFDIVGFDSCMMSMVEIVHAVREHASYVIGSQGNEDDLGWPFADVLQPLVASPTMSPVNLAINTVDKYNTYYLDYALIANSSACLSAFRVDKLNDLTDAVKNFVRASLAILPRTDIDHQTPLDRVVVALYVAAHWEAQTYREDQFTDLYDFCERFVKQAEAMIHIHGQIFRGLQQVIDACKRINELLCRDAECDYPAGKAIVTSCSVGTKYQYSHGISLYFPWNKIDEHYSPGDPTDPTSVPDDFAKKSRWAEFLERYIACSQRPQRYRHETSKIPDETKELIKILFRDPPEGKGILDFEPETAKNPPTKWWPAPCVIEPIRR